MKKNIKFWALWAGGATLIACASVIWDANLYVHQSNQPQPMAVAAIRAGEVKGMHTSVRFNSSQGQTNQSGQSAATNNQPSNSLSAGTPASGQINHRLSQRSSTPAPTATPTLTPTPTLAPTPTSTATPPATSNTALWGAYVGDDPSDLAPFEQLVGRPVNIQAEFVGWDDSFPSALAANLKPAGKTLLIFWEPYNFTYAQMTNGSQDAYIKTFASQIQSYDGPVILAPFEEMNGNWDPWDGPLNGNSPAQFIALWQYVHKFFVGIPNLKFAWDVNNESDPDTTANAIPLYYPGSSYVDYVGVDGFNFGDPWQTWGQVFPQSLMQQLASYGKPVYILSTASAEGSLKAQWISDMGAGVKQYNLAGWVWFNQNKEENWLINSDPASLAEFQTILP